MALSTLSTYKVSLIGALILCDLGKQVCNYGMRYYSKTEEYPIPQSLLVAMLEIIKFTIVFVRTGGTVDRGFLRSTIGGHFHLVWSLLFQHPV